MITARAAPVAKARRGHRGRLFFLAFDHRQSFAREMLGTSLVDADSAKRLQEAKRVVFDGLLLAAGSGEVMSEEVALMIDERFGGEIPGLARQRGMPVAVAVERSGQEIFEFEYGDDFEAHIERTDPDFSKVLVRLNPAGERAGERLQLDRLKLLGDLLQHHGRGFLFELLVPPTAEQLSEAGNIHTYEIEMRPGLIENAMARIQAHGIEPDVWKVEGIDSLAAAARVAAQARAEERWADVSCTVLGAGAPDERVRSWLGVAARTEGYEGFAIGRSIWRDSLRLYLDGDLDREAVSAEVARRYLDFARVYAEAE